MRTKTLVLSAAALLAGVLASSAQVYSANVVGYVNKSFDVAYDYFMICNPLDAGNNSLTNILASAPLNTSVILWDGTNQDFAIVGTYTLGGSGWSDGNNQPANPQIAPGIGFFISPGAPFTNTFVGNVLQGSLTNSVTILGNYNYTALGSMVPVAGNITNALVGIDPRPGDTYQPWDSAHAVQDFSLIAPAYQSDGTWSPANVNYAAGEGFMYISSKPTDSTWIRTFTVQ